MGIQTPNGFNRDNSGKRIVVDPVTRIEGHMRVEVNVDADNVIRNAVSSGTMWRGIEVILKDRDPPRRLGVHGTDLRRLHRHARADVGARGRERALLSAGDPARFPEATESRRRHAKSSPHASASGNAGRNLRISRHDSIAMNLAGAPKAGFDLLRMLF